MQVRGQAPREAGAQPLLESRDFLGRAITRDDYLLLRFVKSVERVKKFLLCALFAGNKFDIVHQEHVDLPIFFPEGDHPVVTKRIDNFIGEILGGNIRKPHFFPVSFDCMPDSVHQVGLSQANSAVKKQWIVGLGGSFSHGHRCGTGELVTGAHDERIEGISRVQLMVGRIKIKFPLQALRLADRRRLPFGRLIK